MTLQGKRAIAVCKRRHGAELGTCNHLPVGRNLDNLVLVERMYLKGVVAIAKPVGRGVLQKVIAMHAYAPAFLGLDDPAAQRLRQQLMPKTNANDWHGRLIGVTQESFQPCYPRVRVIRAESGPRDDPRITDGGLFRQLVLQRRKMFVSPCRSDIAK